MEKQMLCLTSYIDGVVLITVLLEQESPLHV